VKTKIVAESCAVSLKGFAPFWPFFHFNFVAALKMVSEQVCGMPFGVG